MIVCSCHGITDREIRRLARTGASTLRAVAETCGAGSGCGGCRASVRAILAAHKPAAPESSSVRATLEIVSVAAEPA